MATRCLRIATTKAEEPWEISTNTISFLVLLFILLEIVQSEGIAIGNDILRLFGL